MTATTLIILFYCYFYFYFLHFEEVVGLGFCEFWKENGFKEEVVRDALIDLAACGNSSHALPRNILLYHKSIIYLDRLFRLQILGSLSFHQILKVMSPLP